MASVIRPELGAFISAVAAVSCNGGQTGAAQTPTPSSSPTIEVAAAGATMSTVVDEDPEESTVGLPPGALGARIAGLRKHRPWHSFRRLWRELDGIVPAAQPSPLSSATYAQAIDAERAKALSTKLDRLLRRLEQGKLLTRQEVAFFRRVTSLRIQNMTHGFAFRVLSHEAPRPHETYRDRTVDKLEQKIDVLVDLRKRGAIGSPELQAALRQVQRQAVTLYMLEAVPWRGFRWDPLSGPSDGANMLAQLERQLVQAQQDAGVADESLAQVVQEAKERLPVIRALVAELER